MMKMVKRHDGVEGRSEKREAKEAWK